MLVKTSWRKKPPRATVESRVWVFLTVFRIFEKLNTIFFASLRVYSSFAHSFLREKDKIVLVLVEFINRDILNTTSFCN